MLIFLKFQTDILRKVFGRGKQVGAHERCLKLSKRSLLAGYDGIVFHINTILMVTDKKTSPTVLGQG